jgi:NADPH:quinone reductase-like Zn-dependent oxidoreductase
MWRLLGYGHRGTPLTRRLHFVPRDSVHQLTGSADHMKAVVYDRFGPPDVLEVRDVPIPTPGDDEVLVRIHATTVTAAEAAMRRGRPWWGRVVLGFLRPRRRMRTLGTELAGVVASVGRNVTRFRVGDEVFGFAGFRIGANAEYMRLGETASLSIKPTNTSFEEAAAAVDGGSTALFFLRDKAGVGPGDRVLIVGASGSIGSFAVQLARHFGADVTGVCSTRNVELVESLGAQRVVDYTREDFTRANAAYDIVFDTAGKSSFAACRGTLAPGGRYVATTGLVNYFLALWTRAGGGKRVVTGMSVDKSGALPFLRSLIEAGQLRIVIDRCYPMEEIVEAHRYVDSGRKRGNVAIRVAE